MMMLLVMLRMHVSAAADDDDDGDDNDLLEPNFEGLANSLDPLMRRHRTWLLVRIQTNEERMNENMVF
ncbi:hypothetical protein DPMN_111968 [Dreissena polymorpha]|uniref:Secreted protein n=1 Tax=Dreissena polymorpha TaxID=45954 RepID=A0A9D4QQF8_DREPO|nr:hypothetical protein DPMN_111968 [Dreissena polymorpha]